MAVSIIEADLYIASHTIDLEDWTDADEAKKTRILNVAFQTLTDKFPSDTIPDDAVYSFAPILATAFSDTFKMQMYGVRNFSVDGTSFTFDKSSADLSKLIPERTANIIAQANGNTVVKRRIGRSVR